MAKAKDFITAEYIARYERAHPGSRIPPERDELWEAVEKHRQDLYRELQRVVFWHTDDNWHSEDGEVKPPDLNGAAQVERRMLNLEEQYSAAMEGLAYQHGFRFGRPGKKQGSLGNRRRTTPKTKHREVPASLVANTTKLLKSVIYSGDANKIFVALMHSQHLPSDISKLERKAIEVKVRSQANQYAKKVRRQGPLTWQDVKVDYSQRLGLPSVRTLERICKEHNATLPA